MKIRSSLLLWLAFVPGLVHALGLGNIQLESALNEPFKARIELLSTTVDDINSLNVSLADEAAFRRSGIPRASVLKQLQFSVKESDAGPDYILITSDDPIREPFLDFLVEVNWSKGRLYREYTVLLDPPVYIAEEMHKMVTPPTARGAAAGAGREIREEEQTVIHYPEYKPAKTPTTAPAGPVEYTGGDYGPVASGESLWSIAREMRPDSSVSIQQMMLALLRANPEAFINGNINGLKRGHVLKAPDLSEARSLDKDEAYAQAHLQNNMWEEFRQTAAMTPPVRPEGAPAQTEPVVSEPVEKPAEKAQETRPADVEGHPELRLVAPGEASESATQGGEAEPGKEALTKELALARETLEALNLENTELKDKISDSDAIVSDLKRLITLKETELAALQQQIAKNAAITETAKPATAVTETSVMETPPAPAQDATPSTKEIAETSVSPRGDQQQDQVTAPAQQTATPKPEKKKEPSMVFSVLDAAAGLAAQLRNNLLYIVGALGVALAVFAGAYFVQRRRKETVQVQPGTYADFSEEPTIAADSEDSTDMNLAGGEQMGQEAITIQPGQSSETTQQVAGVPTAVASPKEAVTFAAEDALEEVNVFLAYEHFDQAEEFVRNALEKEPDNLAYHIKLLEVYYTADNKKAYEEAARVLHDKVQGKGDYWGMALAMWQVLSPNRALFAVPAAGEEVEAPAAKEAGGIVIITGDGEATSGGLDFDLDTTGGGAGTGDTLEEEASVEADVLDVTAVADTADSDILDITSTADTSDAGAVEQETIAANADDQGLEFSLELDDKGPEEDQPLDISMDLLQEESEAPAAPAIDDDQGLEFSLELDDKAPEEDQPLDISLGSLPGKGEAPAEPVGDENALDFSLDFEGPAHEDKAAMSQGSGVVPELDVSHSGSDLLDVTAAIDVEDMAQDISGQSATAQGADLLDVASATDFNAESGEDLLDVTFSGNIPVKEKDDDSALDFELAPDQPVSGNESATAFDGIDITAGQGLELEGVSSPESEEDAFELDMDATMQIPTKRSSLSGKDEADSTLVVPRTSGDSQTEEDEIATQMDLAKAYIELGNADSAKTILDEIIVIGNDMQRRQAQELLGQIT